MIEIDRNSTFRKWFSPYFDNNNWSLYCDKALGSLAHKFNLHLELYQIPNKISKIEINIFTKEYHDNKACHQYDIMFVTSLLFTFILRILFIV